MSDALSRHFIVFHRTGGHCAMWLARAASLRDALRTYALQECAGAELAADGSLLVDDGWGGKNVYAHPLECIEAEEKVWEGLHGTSWEIRELAEGHWEAEFAEVFCSASPVDMAGYVAACLPAFRRDFPNTRARAFLWYLRDGPLITFYRHIPRRRRAMSRDTRILRRYHLPWKTYPQVSVWEGTYDDLLAQLHTACPLPR